MESVSLIIDSLEIQDAHRLLEWIVENEWKNCCETYSGSDASFSDTILSETANSNIDYYIATFLWRMFGHPDKRNRFWAQHVLWRYVNFKSSVIMPCLFDLYCSNNIPKIFLNNGNYFFIESAQISFLEASLFLADRLPEMLKEYYDFYEKIATNDATQHALKRHLAMKVCKKIISAYAVKESVSLDDCEKCMVENKNKMHSYERERDGKRKLKFHIDTMDTTRYWYDDVAELFGCTQGDVAELCDFYISNEFNITNQMSEEWQKKYYHQQYYGRASNDHGGIPSYETLRKYAEWHSMFYAADFLRRTSSIVDDDEELDYGSWLDSFLPGKEDVWGYEMRSYPPLLKVLWNPDFLSAKKGKEGYSIPENFVETLMDDKKNILLSLECLNVESQCRKNILLTSVVVEESNLGDFILELKKDSYAIYDYLYREDDWRENKNFYVYSTCVNYGHFSDKSSDMKDPLAKEHLELQNCNMCLSPDVFSEVGEVSLKNLRAREQKAEEFGFYKWYEPESESGYDKIGTYGYMVSVDGNYLMSVLRKNSWNLVCKVTVELEDEYGSYKDKQDKIKQELLWIMKKNGDTEVILLEEERE